MVDIDEEASGVKCKISVPLLPVVDVDEEASGVCLNARFQDTTLTCGR